MRRANRKVHSPQGTALVRKHIARAVGSAHQKVVLFHRGEEDAARPYA